MPKIKLIQGDCLELMKDIPDGSIDAIITDPPYNINKADWDKWETKESYIEWCSKWILECQRVLKDNGSFYFFHNDMPQIAMLMEWIRQNTRFVYKQFIVWNKRFDGAKNKGFLDGFVETGALRNYQKMAEYCLFYTFQDETGLLKIMGHCVYPIRDYIRSEIERAKGKIVLKEVNTVLGTAINGGGVASACLSLNKTHPAMMTEEHYLKLRDWLNKGREYEYLRREYEDLRYTFNNQKTHHSVWNYEIGKKEGHITQKPIGLVENIIKHSSNEGDIILDPFMGSGTTLVAAARLGRNAIGIELEESYYKIAADRVKKEAEQQKLFQRPIQICDDNGKIKSTGEREG